MIGRMLECWGGYLDGFTCSSSVWQPIPGMAFVWDGGRDGYYVADTVGDLFAPYDAPIRLIWTPREQMGAR